MTVHWEDGAGSTSDISRGFLVIGGGRVSDAVQAAPNRLDSTNGYATTLTIASAQAYSLSLRVYTLAGELVDQRDGAMGANSVGWDATDKASGLYLAVVEAKAPAGGVVQRQILKLLVIH
jgi:hypothetical protein